MAKTAKIRITTKAQTISLQNREEVEVAIKEVGDLQRELLRTITEQNDKIARVTEEYAPKLQKIKDKIEPMTTAIQSWCEANRTELTQNGKTKTAEFNTGTVQWRQNPPSCSIRGLASVIENLKTLGLTRFIRSKEEINKEAMLNEPDIASTVAGVTIKTGTENFVVSPFEQKAS